MIGINAHFEIAEKHFQSSFAFERILCLLAKLIRVSSISVITVCLSQSKGLYQRFSDLATIHQLGLPY